MKSSNTENIRQSFTVQAENFESQTMNFSKKEYLDYTVSCMQPLKTDAVLEVAAGTCACGRSIAPFVQNVTCLDMTEAMLLVGKQEAEKDGITNITFVLGDAQEQPFLDHSFDIVISRLAFHHFPHTDRPFQEMARVLKPGGKLVLIDMEAAEEDLRKVEDEIETLRDPSHIRNLSKTEILELFQTYGIEVTLCESKVIPVSLHAWLTLTNTPSSVCEEISARLAAEIKGGAKTGFRPYDVEGEIHFQQRWIMSMGKND